MPLDSLIDHPGRSLLAEFDRKQRRLHLSPMKKTRKSVYLGDDLIRAAQHRGLSLADYIAHLHAHHTSLHAAQVASVYRGFALLEMARVPVDPAYFELVYGVLGEETGTRFHKSITENKPLALPKAAAQLLGADTRVPAMEAIFLAATRASVMHEGYLEGARLLEASLHR
ncbi:MAG: hypothetical protein SFU85_13505 [Candidatus Methylacidiphilales bacterium]|nr:hypothetical protein [Candidatus Methylacidiphilales bacterium]